MEQNTESTAVTKRGVLCPKLFAVRKDLTKAQLLKDLVAGVIVAIIALPLSIALALASGVNPEQGLYTAIVAGFLVSFFGGSRVQIAGPTAAFATIVAGIVATDGMEGLVISTVMAGILLVLMGVFRLGALIRYIPSTITEGFTFGIAVTILVGQIKDFLGLTYTEAPIETIEKMNVMVSHLDTLNWQALVVGMIALAIMIFWPKKLKMIPASLIAVLVTSALVGFSGMRVNTIGDLYEISSALPTLHVPALNLETVRAQIPNAFTIAILAAVESLLSCVVSDGMIGSRHNSNMELIAQGIANVGSALFGGIPATGAIARTAANVNNGGRTPVAGMVHAVVVLLILVLLMPYAALIPMPTIAAILFVVAYNMSGWRGIWHTIKTAPKSDVLVLLLTLVLTVVFDLVVAIAVGMVLAAILFMKRMADVTESREWQLVTDESNDPQSLRLRKVPEGTEVFEINGPMFFAAANKYTYSLRKSDVKVLIVRMRNVPAIDATGMETLEELIASCKKRKIAVVFSHLNEQPQKAMEKAGLIKAVGAANICTDIDAALQRAETLCKATAQAQ